MLSAWSRKSRAATSDQVISLRSARMPAGVSQADDRRRHRVPLWGRLQNRSYRVGNSATAEAGTGPCRRDRDRLLSRLLRQQLDFERADLDLGQGARPLRSRHIDQARHHEVISQARLKRYVERG
jgi:hypothetical protein